MRPTGGGVTITAPRPAPPPKKKSGGKFVFALFVVLAAVAWTVWDNTGGYTPPEEPPSYEWDIGPTGAADWPDDVLTAEELLATRDNTQAQTTTLGAGEWIAGEDFEPGRYTVTADDPDSWASVTVSNSGVWAPGPAVLSVSLSWNEDRTERNTATFTLPRTATLMVEGDGSVTLTPAVTAEFSGVLGAGDWDAGIDFEPGFYLVEGDGESVLVALLGPPADGENVWARELGGAYIEPTGQYGEKYVELDVQDGDSLYLDRNAKLTWLGSL
jgi:hypothetical protein